ncbi:hypothetical protein P7H06_13645 [Paenibacillus larvae]|nr:hypothetical protein [Paenibacillus larvae]MDT2260342.1 hypothetical protein [Paenibacillus larvae]
MDEGYQKTALNRYWLEHIRKEQCHHQPWEHYWEGGERISRRLWVKIRHRHLRLIALERFPEPSIDNEVNAVKIEYHIEFYYQKAIYEFNQHRFAKGLESILY